VDAAGNLVIADTDNNRIRVVAASAGTFYGLAMTAGDIYTVAGDGTFGFSGDGGPAISAEFRAPRGVAVDGSGNLVITDQFNNRVRVVAVSTGTFYGRAMTAGDIYTVAGDGTAGSSGDGGPAISAELRFPADVRVDAGNLIIADSGNGEIRVVAATTGTFFGRAMTAGDIYTVAGGGGGDDGGPALGAEIDDPDAVAVDGVGNLLIGGNGGSLITNRVRMVAARTGTFYGQAMTAGDIYTVAGNGTLAYSGDGRAAARAQLNGMSGVLADSAGNLLIADTGNSRIRVKAARTGTFYGQAMTTGNIYTVAGGGNGGDGGPATGAGLFFPDGVALDRMGNVLIADSNDNRVRVVAAGTGTFYGQPMTAGHIYTIAGSSLRCGFPRSGIPATAARLCGPFAMMTDGAGNVVISDTGNHRIRVVAVTSGRFYGRAMIAEDIYTVAGGGASAGDGGPATKAALTQPMGVTVDAAGNVLIADAAAGRIRAVAVKSGTFYGQAMTRGHIYTVAGNGTAGFSGDGGLGINAELNSPSGVAADGSGNLVIADPGDNRIRMLAR
jgi:hypothetical protein